MQIWQIMYEDQGVGIEEEYFLVDNVTDLIFMYFDVNGNDLGDLVVAGDFVNIWMIQIDMMVIEVVGREGIVIWEFIVWVLCWNLGYGMQINR